MKRLEKINAVKIKSEDNISISDLCLNKAIDRLLTEQAENILVLSQLGFYPWKVTFQVILSSF